MSDNLYATNKLIQDYFSEQYKSNPQASQEGILRGWLEDARARAFQDSIAENIRFVHVVESVDLQNPLIRVFHNNFSVLIAIVADTMLWLDNHSDDTDYSIYMSKEQLFDKLPRTAISYAQCILDTKLNYLSQPRLVQLVDDIPVSESLASNRTTRETIEKLEQLRNHILPSTLTLGKTGFRVEFCVWTRIRGTVFRIECRWDGKQFGYSGEILASSFGDYFMYR